LRSSTIFIGAGAGGRLHPAHARFKIGGAPDGTGKSADAKIAGNGNADRCQLGPHRAKDAGGLIFGLDQDFDRLDGHDSVFLGGAS
jgi:hypothetical protein